MSTSAANASLRRLAAWFCKSEVILLQFATELTSICNTYSGNKGRSAQLHSRCDIYKDPGSGYKQTHELPHTVAKPKLFA